MTAAFVVTALLLVGSWVGHIVKADQILSLRASNERLRTALAAERSARMRAEGRAELPVAPLADVLEFPGGGAS